MSNIRLIARLDIKGPNLIKGIHFEGLRKIGSPGEHALRYYSQGADELLFMDAVASLYGRNHLGEIIEAAAKDIFIPITVGGGIRNLGDVRKILRSGADKVAVNTAAVENPTLITEIAHAFGSQCLVVSIEAKKASNNRWEVYTNNGRERTGLDVVDWSKKVVELGAGEILLTSVDRDGTKSGFDLEIIKTVSAEVTIPVIASGGMGVVNDFLEVVEDGHADAVAMASVLHYQTLNIGEIRRFAKSNGIYVRNYE
jgi:cyclase